MRFILGSCILFWMGALLPVSVMLYVRVSPANRRPAFGWRDAIWLAAPNVGYIVCLCFGATGKEAGNVIAEPCLLGISTGVGVFLRIVVGRRSATPAAMWLLAAGYFLAACLIFVFSEPLAAPS